MICLMALRGVGRTVVIGGAAGVVVVQTGKVRGGVSALKGQSWKTLLHHQISRTLGLRL